VLEAFPQQALLGGGENSERWGIVGGCRSLGARPCRGLKDFGLFCSLSLSDLVMT
jgi:hypothetical protein